MYKEELLKQWEKDVVRSVNRKNFLLIAYDEDTNDHYVITHVNDQETLKNMFYAFFRDKEHNPFIMAAFEKYYKACKAMEMKDNLNLN